MLRGAFLRRGGLPPSARRCPIQGCSPVQFRFCAATAAEPWRVLGVPRNATLEEARAAYQKLLARVHPDKPGGSDEEFLKVQQAWKDFQQGPPSHMVYGNEDPDRAMDALARDWLSRNVHKATGLEINWKNSFNRYDVRRSGWAKKVIIGYSAFWFLYVCDPWQPHWMLYMLLAYLFDRVTGGWLLGLVIVYLWWKSVNTGLAEGAYMGANYYWDVGRPTALTMAMGIPNYWWSKEKEVVQNRAQVLDTNRQGYGRFLGKKGLAKEQGGQDEDDDDFDDVPLTAAQRIAEQQKAAQTGANFVGEYAQKERMVARGPHAA
eukprot:Hpha_TRINITY_DN19478_c0_g1::TRINITY_DN19478_c0_g1_i1::g.45807::m.45807